MKKLTITACDAKTTGVSKTGKDWTLYEVSALNEAGEAVEAELKSFDDLPIGELLEFEVERQEHPKYGVSFLLKRPGISSSGGSPGARLGPKVDELRVRVEKLEARVEKLERAGQPQHDEVPF